MTRDELRAELLRPSRQFLGGSWARRIPEIRKCLLERDPSTYLQWDFVKRNMLVTSTGEVLAKQETLLGEPSPAQIFEFGPGIMRRWERWAQTLKYYVYDMPEMIALQRWIAGVEPTYSTDLAAFLSLVRDNAGEKSAFIACWSLSECPISIRDMALDCAAECCGSILLAYQPVFDFIDNNKYFPDFAERHGEFDWTLHSASPLDGNYLVGRKAE